MATFGFLKTEKENNQPQIEKTSKRVGYPAYAKVKEDKKGKQWYFDHVEEAHNHKLHPSPRMVRYMHAHKQREAVMDDMFAIISRNGVAHQAAMNPFTEKDVKNMKATNVQAEHTDDINKLIEFFKDCEAQNPQFQWDPKLDSQGVFKAFKKCMGGSRTRCILTDQYQAMGVAIAKEFPGHMPQLTNLFGMYVKRNFKDKFYFVLNHPLTPMEFEDSTLDSLYRQRELYVPAYFKDQYCGKMASTQRSESSNFVMKSCFVDKHTALHRFAKKTLDFVHSRKMKKSEETYHGTVIARGSQEASGHLKSKLY
uniref:Protein FAR1-RELATED SEQUENCE n=1 Tax=Setaria italica TaxID=4555 RepID=K3Z067_SETIT